MTREEYIAELLMRADSKTGIGQQLGSARALREAAALAKSLDMLTWRDVTPESPAVGEPVIIMLRGMFALVERDANGEWWTDWSAGHQRIHSSGRVATRYLPIPADEVHRG